MKGASRMAILACIRCGCCGCGQLQSEIEIEYDVEDVEDVVGERDLHGVRHLIGIAADTIPVINCGMSNIRVHGDHGKPRGKMRREGEH
jgi:hypothetical protein